MSGVIGKVVLGAGAGAAGVAAANNGLLDDFSLDSITDLASELSRATMHHLSKPGKDGSSSGDSSSSGDDAETIRQMNAAIQSLSAQVTTLTTMRSQPQMVVVGGGSGGRSWSLAAVGIGGVAGYTWWKGWWRFDQVMPVNKAQFNEGIGQLRTKLQNVMESVRRTKQELMERIGLVQAQIEESTAQIESKIESEVGSVRSEMGEFNDKLTSLDGKLDEAVNGITLLVGTVSDLSNPNRNQNQRGATGIQNADLQDYVRRNNGGAQRGGRGFSGAAGCLDNKPYNPAMRFPGLEDLLGGDASSACQPLTRRNTTAPLASPLTTMMNNHGLLARQNSL